MLLRAASRPSVLAAAGDARGAAGAAPDLDPTRPTRLQILVGRRSATTMRALLLLALLALAGAAAAGRELQGQGARQLLLASRTQTQMLLLLAVA